MVGKAVGVTVGPELGCKVGASVGPGTRNQEKVNYRVLVARPVYCSGDRSAGPNSQESCNYAPKQCASGDSKAETSHWWCQLTYCLETSGEQLPCRVVLPRLVESF